MMATNKKNPKFNRNDKRSKGETFDKESCFKKDRTRQLHDSMNDASWYYQNEQLLRDTASLSYNSPLGLTLPANSVSEIQKYIGQALPGMVRCGFVPVPGICNSNADALNIAAKNIYSFVRHQNSGSKNYDAPDYMLYLVCLDSLYMLFNEGQRAYGVAGYYSATNRYYPSALLTALGFDAADLISNLADFRAFLNTCAAKINSLCAPKKMKIFERHSWMVSRIYLDSMSSKPTAIFYVPDAYYAYDELSGAGRATQQTRPNTLTVAQYKGLFNTLFNALNDSEDIGVMSGDTLKAFGSDLWTIAPVPAEYVTPIVYEEEVLMQFHNASFLGVPTNLDITQGTQIGVDAGVLKCNPSFLAAGVSAPTTAAKYAVLDTNKTDVGPEDTMVYTRLTQVIPRYEADPDTASGKCTPETCGTEIGTIMHVYYNQRSSDGLRLAEVSLHSLESSAALSTVELCQLSRVDGFPGIWISGSGTDVGGSTVEFARFLFENLDNYTTIGMDTLKRMNDCALLAEFGVPAGDGWSLN